MPSLRAQLVRRTLVAGLRLQRRMGAGDVDPEAPEERLMEYALELREQMERLTAYARLPGWARTMEADNAPLPTLWVTNDRADLDRVVLHLHGGGYFMGSPSTHRGLAATISRTARAWVVMPDYRLAPEHRFPAALDDAVTSYRWLLEDQGVDPGRLAVSGDSAGGGLAVALMVRARDEGLPLPACYVGLSPWTDLAATGESHRTKDGVDPWLRASHVPAAARGYTGDTPVDDPLVSPLYADLHGLPPMLVHAGTDEILLDDARRLVDRASAAGVDATFGGFEGMWHVFQAFPMVPEARQSLREIGGFIRRHTDGVDDRQVSAA